MQPLARVRLLAALVAAALQAPASSNERAAVVCRIVADGLPAAAIALQVAAGVLPQLASTDQWAWTQAAEACQALMQALHAAAQHDAPLSLRAFDSTTAALLAALQQRALLKGMEDHLCTWREHQREEGLAALLGIHKNITGAAEAAEEYCASLAVKLWELTAEQTAPVQEGCPGQPGQAALPNAASSSAAAAAADASHRLDAVARAHAACASLLHLLAPVRDHWIGADPGPVRALKALLSAARLLWEACWRSG